MRSAAGIGLRSVRGAGTSIVDELLLADADRAS